MRQFGSEKTYEEVFITALYSLVRGRHVLPGKDRGSIPGPRALRDSGQNGSGCVVGELRIDPGGITLEGKADGLPPIRDTVYDARNNVFVLNGELQYACPVSAEELREIALAIEREDALGFTFQTKETIYGALSPQGRIASNLKRTNLYLGRRVFAPSDASGPQKADPGPPNRLRGDSVNFR